MLLLRILFLTVTLLTPSVLATAQEKLRVNISWGHQSASSRQFNLKLVSQQVQVLDTAPQGMEATDNLRDGAWQSRAGSGDVDGIELTLSFAPDQVQTRQNLNIIWADLIAQSDTETAQRLSSDPSLRIDPRVLTFQMNREATSGFSLTVDQLLTHKTIWVPSLDIFISAGERSITFAAHQEKLQQWKGKRILDQVKQQPEATYEEYTKRWEDMGNPMFTYPEQRGPGHIVGVTWDSAIPKYGIDRGAGVWNDYGNPDQFRLWLNFGDLSHGIVRTWKSQTLQDGLPVITTTFEDDGVRYEVEQYAYPLNGPPKERRGEIPMVLCEKIKVLELEGRTRTIPVTLNHQRKLPDNVKSVLKLQQHDGGSTLESDQGVLLTVQGVEGRMYLNGVVDYQKELKRANVVVPLMLAANGSREFVVKLPSPVAALAERQKLLSLDYAEAKQQTLNFWLSYVNKGAMFKVPEKVVNDLYRANLWHALRLPRRHDAPQSIDLPYSNFAYGQTGTPWPVNQSVYVDYMIYDLRGYHDISAEELEAIFNNNQEPNGHVKGYANWVVYTPGMLYSVAQNYLLSGNRQAFDKLLPYSLKALDWCLHQVAAASRNPSPNRGLVYGPLNDLTGEGTWAFNQAYLYGGMELFGQALRDINHPRAQEALDAAQNLRRDINTSFRAASVRAPLVQLRDHTWIPYVPTESSTSGRLMDQWYPTDVDTGALHLLRLQAISANGDLAESLLNDHEDNLFLKGWGIANEPIYNQQSTAYLLRDDAPAVIRGFYSYLACGFSHHALEPVEHRWTHGQYFGPPSTDGAWFELYRRMLINDMEDGTLLLGQAIPRKWLEDGKKIEVERAPTYYGNLSMAIESKVSSGEITVNLQMSQRRRPQSVLLRLRHPQGKLIRAVTVNGKEWMDFDTVKDWIRLRNPNERVYSVTARY